MWNLKIPVVFTLKCLLFSFLCSPASEFSFNSTKVKLHQAATLPCYQPCSGLVVWVDQYDSVAQCDQTSCRSTEGFQMFHDQYLKGNLSLIITEADFSKRMWYTCQCNRKDICAVSLRLNPFSYTVHVQAGQTLSLDLHVPDDVEVTFNRTGDDGSRLCRTEGRKLQCDSLYKQRVSLISSLQLEEVQNQDGGIYILRDIKNDEVIGTYTVTVNETRPESSDGLPGETSPGPDGSVATPVAVALGVLLVFAALVIVGLCVENQHLRKRLQQQENPPQIRMSELQQHVEPQVEMQALPEDRVCSPVMETIDDQQEIIEQKKLEDDPENEENIPRDERDRLLRMVESPESPAHPPLSLPVPDSCSTNTQVFK